MSDRIVSALTNRGAQLVVFGESGAGKSTVIINELARRKMKSIRTICTTSSTYESIILDAFDQLDQWVVSERRRTREIKATASALASMESAGIRASLGSSRESGETSVRLVDPQVTAQRLGTVLGKAGVTWVIDDFHKVPNVEKVALAQAMKVFSDLSVSEPRFRAIVLGATETAQEVVELDNELANRVAEIPVSTFSDEELGAILEQGGKLLRIDFSEVADEIVRMSVGTASVAHGIARQCALVLGVERTSKRSQRVGRADLTAAVERYVLESEATLRTAFDRGLRRDRIRRYDNCRLILEALARLPESGAHHAEILAEIRRQESSYGPGNLTNYSRQLLTEERGELLKQGMDGRFKFQSPLVHAYARSYFNVTSPVGRASGFEEALEQVGT